MVIVGEAPASYADARFWAKFFKPFADARFGRTIALFGSYGSPFAGSCLEEKTTLMDFAVEQRMSIRPLTRNNLQLSIFFIRQEFEDEIRLMRSQSDVGDQPFILFTDCLEDPVALFQRAPWRHNDLI